MKERHSETGVITERRNERQRGGKSEEEKGKIEKGREPIKGGVLERGQESMKRTERTKCPHKPIRN